MFEEAGFSIPLPFGRRSIWLRGCRRRSGMRRPEEPAPAKAGVHGGEQHAPAAAPVAEIVFEAIAIVFNTLKLSFSIFQRLRAACAMASGPPRSGTALNQRK